MGFGSKHLDDGKTEVRRPSRRDGLGAALRNGWTSARGGGPVAGGSRVISRAW